MIGFAKRTAKAALGLAVVGLMSSQAPAQETAAAYQAPRIALDNGAAACVGLLQDALHLTVEGDHQELSSWHPAQAASRTFWTAQVDHGGNRGAFVSVTPTDDRHCDASTVRMSYLKQDCKSAAVVFGKGGSAPMAMADATVVQRDATGRLAMFIPGGAGCVFVEMATLYGR